MPDLDLNNQTSKVFSNPIDEISHITEEIYKKNSELNDKNKTLALLRNIDSIVISAVTDPKLIGQQVSDLLVKEDLFQFVEIYVHKEVMLTPLAISIDPKSSIMQKYSRDKFMGPPFLLTDRHNYLVRTVNHKYVHTTNNLHEVLTKYVLEQEGAEIQKELGIKAAIAYPLIVRGDVIGVLVMGIIENQEELSADKKALIDRLAGVVGIALDNALLYQSIQEANERLRQLDKLKDEFVSLASHELRTPMTIIKSYIWMFLHKKGDELDEKEKSYLVRAYSTTDRLIKLVNDMLNVSRIESGRLKLEMKDLDIDKLVTTVVKELTPRAKELGLNLSLEKNIELIKLLNGDEDRIEEILINFIGNSLKFTPPGGFIKVTLTARDKDVLINIADNGKGIKKEDMPRLFHKFETMGNAYLQKQQSQGSGLGLYLSKSLIELHGGKVGVESAGENKGSIFSFTLPYNEDKPHQEAEVLPSKPIINGSGTVATDGLEVSSAK